MYIIYTYVHIAFSPCRSRVRARAHSVSPFLSLKHTHTLVPSVSLTRSLLFALSLYLSLALAHTTQKQRVCEVQHKMSLGRGAARNAWSHKGIKTITAVVIFMTSCVGCDGQLDR